MNKTLFAGALAALAVVVAPHAYADPVSAADNDFLQDVLSFGITPAALHLSEGIPQEIQVGRGICDDLLGKVTYSNTPDKVLPKVSAHQEIASLRKLWPVLSEDDAQMMITAAMHYPACEEAEGSGAIDLPWIDDLKKQLHRG